MQHSAILRSRSLHTSFKRDQWRITKSCDETGSPNQRFVTELNGETRRGWDRNYPRSDRIMASSWHGDFLDFRLTLSSWRRNLSCLGTGFRTEKIPTGFHQKRERQGLEQGQDNTRTTPGQHQDNARTDPRTCPEVVLSPRLSPGQHSGQCPASPLTRRSSDS